MWPNFAWSCSPCSGGRLRELAQPLLANLSLPLERHEWEYGLGPAAALLLLAGAARVAGGAG